VHLLNYGNYHVTLCSLKNAHIKHINNKLCILLLIVNIDTALKKFISQEIDTNENNNGISKLLYYYLLNSLLTIIILYLAYKYR